MSGMAGKEQGAIAFVVEGVDLCAGSQSARELRHIADATMLVQHFEGASCTVPSGSHQSPNVRTQNAVADSVCELCGKKRLERVVFALGHFLYKEQCARGASRSARPHRK